jgi:hypothetical protein
MKTLGCFSGEKEVVRSKAWFLYTDESGALWRIQTSPALADIGGLKMVDSKLIEPLPAYIKPRYVWLKEEPRPTDRVATRQKVFIDREQLKFMLGASFEVAGKTMRTQSYYGEVVSLP